VLLKGGEKETTGGCRPLFLSIKLEKQQEKRAEVRTRSIGRSFLHDVEQEQRDAISSKGRDMDGGTRNWPRLARRDKARCLRGSPSASENLRENRGEGGHRPGRPSWRVFLVL